MIVVARNKSKPTAFGSRLRQLREAKGLTLTQLAESLGMKYQALAKYEYGTNEPNWPTVLRIATALEVTPDAFLSDPAADADEPAPKKRGKG